MYKEPVGKAAELAATENLYVVHVLESKLSLTEAATKFLVLRQKETKDEHVVCFQQ